MWELLIIVTFMHFHGDVYPRTCYHSLQPPVGHILPISSPLWRLSSLMVPVMWDVRGTMGHCLTSWGATRICRRVEIYISRLGFLLHLWHCQVSALLRYSRQGKIMAAEHCLCIYYTLTDFDLVCSIKYIFILGRCCFEILAVFCNHNCFVQPVEQT